VSESADDKTEEPETEDPETVAATPDSGAEAAEAQAPAPPKPKSRGWVQVLLGIAILLCGMLIGAGGAVLVGRGLILRQSTQVSGAIVRHMSRRLNLTPQQERDVRRIVREHMEQVDQIRNQGRRDIEEELDAMRDEVADVLTPQQAQAWRRQFERVRRVAPPPPGGRWEPPGGHRGFWEPGPRDKDGHHPPGPPPPP